MSPENTAALLKNFPKIFPHSPESIETSWCFECGDGWYELLNKLCEDLQEVIDTQNIPQVVASQVKEKFGTLRFYHRGGNGKTKVLIETAEDMAEATCEVCGEPARLRQKKGSWIQTLCDKHAQ